jgi:hypothetical protein
LHGRNGNNIVIGFTGVGRFPASEIATLGSMFLDWLLRLMVEIGLGVFSPVIEVGIGCMTRCIGMGSPTRLLRNTEMMAYR